jgi:hypothetical protein
MSLHLVDERIRFSLPAALVPESDGIIRRVIHDSDLHGGADLYAVERLDAEGNGAGIYHIRNTNIQHQPAAVDPGIRGILDQFIIMDGLNMDRHFWDAPAQPVPAAADLPDPEEDAPDGVDPEWDNDVFADEEEEDIVHQEEQPQPQPVPNRARTLEEMGQAIREAHQNRLREANADQAQQAVPATTNGNRRRKNWPDEIVGIRLPTPDESRDLTLNGVRPTYMLDIGTTNYPVYDSSNRNFDGVIGINDFRANRMRNRFFFFFINGTAVIPAYNATEDTVFYRTSNGTIWVNQYIHEHVIAIPERVFDNKRVAWCEKTLLDAYLLRNGMAPLPSKKKKLRSKYKEMPIIKDEKHYATKEFIA